jgi:hypothetical protein
MAIPVVDAHLDRPVGHVGEADVDIDPVEADLEPGWIDRALPPLPQLAADLGHLRFQGQAGLPIDVHAPVVSSPKQDGHAPAVGWVVEHLQLQALVVGSSVISKFSIRSTAHICRSNGHSNWPGVPFVGASTTALPSMTTTTSRDCPIRACRHRAFQGRGNGPGRLRTSGHTSAVRHGGSWNRRKENPCGPD